MASSTKFISAAIKSIPAKKEALRKAFEYLQSYSACLSSFTLQWKDIEAYIDSVEKSIKTRFKEVELKEIAKEIKKEKVPVEKLEEVSLEATLRAAELKSLCEKMDGKGLRSFINENRKEVAEIRNEIARALQFACNPAKMVLDAMGDFHNSKRDELMGIRHSCIILLESLFLISPEIKNPAKERAMKLAVHWRGSIGLQRGHPLKTVGFLQLLATYGLVSAFDVDELLDLLVIVAPQKQTIDLFKGLDLVEKIPDFLQKLVSKGKQLQAAKFIYNSELMDKFPPIPLLKAYLKESEKAAQEIRKKGNHSAESHNFATGEEIHAVKEVIKFVRGYKLESEFSSMNLEKRISQFEQQKAQREEKKRAAPKSQHQPPNKKHRPSATTAPYVPSPTSSQRAANQQQPQPSGPLVYLIQQQTKPSGGLAGSGMAGTSMPYDCPGTSFLIAPLGFSAHKPLGYSGYTLSGGLSYHPQYDP
ncbi:truncated FRIGIDA-like protein 1 [Tasmannia lanceolata]|uniref:truncated FRIGIDA-like protein 1 n=1 Tax=Tasmannia lanceolata TaxID=3420 RepID=UPI00406384C1